MPPASVKPALVRSAVHAVSLRSDVEAEFGEPADEPPGGVLTIAPLDIGERVERRFPALSSFLRHRPAQEMRWPTPSVVARSERKSTSNFQSPRPTGAAGHGAALLSVIERFGEATGVPVVLNTSFNLRGEPIVNTPAEAYSTFSRSGMDALVLGDCVIEKERR